MTDQNRRTWYICLTAAACGILLILAALAVFKGCSGAKAHHAAAASASSGAAAKASPLPAASRAALPASPSKTAAAAKPEKEVILDPGHGGPDPGAIGVGGVLEKDLNLQIAEKLKTDFVKKGYSVIMTRNGDYSIYDPGCVSLYDKKNSDLNNRIKIEQRHPQALFISIHQNYSQNPAYAGTQVYYSLNKKGSETLAQEIQSGIEASLEPGNSRKIQSQGSLRVLRKAPIPAVLVECGFISNRSEARLLETGSYQDRLGAAILRAADAYMKSLPH